MTPRAFGPGILVAPLVPFDLFVAAQQAPDADWREELEDFARDLGTIRELPVANAADVPEEER